MTRVLWKIQRRGNFLRLNGWGLHFDEQARVALVSAGTDDYNRLADEPTLAHTRAMRNKRVAD